MLTAGRKPFTHCLHYLFDVSSLRFTSHPYYFTRLYHLPVMSARSSQPTLMRFFSSKKNPEVVDTGRISSQNEPKESKELKKRSRSSSRSRSRSGSISKSPERKLEEPEKKNRTSSSSPKKKKVRHYLK